MAEVKLRDRRQLALGVQLRDDATFDNFFVAEPARPAFHAVRELATAKASTQIYLHGAAESGRTHLLQAACHVAAGSAIYLPLAQFAQAEPEAVLEGAESLDLVCLDDLQAVAGSDRWELALFDFFNRARETGCALLVAADSSVRGLPSGLPDLRSRLAWGMVFQLPRPDDVQRVAILRLRAARRGLTLSEATAHYMVSRAPRGLADLVALLDRLDRHSLAEKRALTRPFVKKSLGW